MAVCGLSLVVARGLLIAVASPMEHGLWGVWASVFVAPRLQSADSVVVAYGLSCSAICGIFLDKGSNPCPLHWQGDSYPMCHQGSLCFCFFLLAWKNGKMIEKGMKAVTP